LNQSLNQWVDRQRATQRVEANRQHDICPFGSAVDGTAKPAGALSQAIEQLARLSANRRTNPAPPSAQGAVASLYRLAKSWRLPTGKPNSTKRGHRQHQPASLQ